MIGRQRSAESRDGVGDLMLRQRDHVEIALDDNHAVGSANPLSCLIKTIERRALVKKRGFAGIEIFGQTIVQHSSAEGDDFAGRTDDWKYHPGEKFFIKLLRGALADQSQTQRIV